LKAIKVEIALQTKLASKDNQSSWDKISLSLQDLNESLSSHLKALQTKAQKLDFAARNNNVGNFECRFGNNGGCHQSRDLVRVIMSYFRRDEGFIYSDYFIGSNTKEGRAAFEKKLTDLIENLTGVKPRVEQNISGNYIMYYS